MIFIGIVVGICYAVLLSAVGVIPALILAFPLLIIWNIVAPRWKTIDYGEAVGFVMIPISIICIAIGMRIGIPVAMIDKQEWSEPTCYVSHEIVNLSDRNEVKGEVRGGYSYVRGYIGEETTYHYYYTRPDGGFDLQKVSGKNVVIYYTDGKPRADWYVQTRSYWGIHDEKYSVRIYIPDGSLSTEYVIDMN